MSRVRGTWVQHGDRGWFYLYNPKSEIALVLLSIPYINPTPKQFTKNYHSYFDLLFDCRNKSKSGTCRLGALSIWVIKACI